MQPDSGSRMCIDRDGNILQIEAERDQWERQESDASKPATYQMYCTLRRKRSCEREAAEDHVSIWREVIDPQVIIRSITILISWTINICDRCCIQRPITYLSIFAHRVSASQTEPCTSRVSQKLLLCLQRVTEQYHRCFTQISDVPCCAYCHSNVQRTWRVFASIREERIIEALLARSPRDLGITVCGQIRVG